MQTTATDTLTVTFTARVLRGQPSALAQISAIDRAIDAWRALGCVVYGDVATRGWIRQTTTFTVTVTGHARDIMGVAMASGMNA